MEHYFFSGIAGSGMQVLALYLRKQGIKVSGSDRSFDLKENGLIRKQLEKSGTVIHKQEGSGINRGITTVVASAAVEGTNPELVRAKRLKIPVKTRGRLLADLCEGVKTLAVGGTSGKTTVTGMAGHIAISACLPVSVFCGGTIKNYENSPSLLYRKKPGLIITEADESDRSILFLSPEISVITNISKDHHSIAELLRIFGTFASQSSGSVIAGNTVKPGRHFPADRLLCCGTGPGAHFRIEKAEYGKSGSAFTLNGKKYSLNIPGKYNVYNAAFAAAACLLLGIPYDAVKSGLSTFKGIKRRLDRIGSVRGIDVYDDFAHNPHKIEALIGSLRKSYRRIHFIYQPHGFKPLMLCRKELVSVFSSSLRERDRLYILDVFYRGGQTDMSFGSDEFAALLNKKRRYNYRANKKDIPGILAGSAQEGDCIVVAGARDNTLTALAENIAAAL